MRKQTHPTYIGIIAICFLYVGSAYMSQSYRLMDFYDERTVDIISSVFNYLMQAIGILIFSLGLVKRPEIFGKRKTFIVLLVTGAFFMIASQLSDSGLIVQLAGYIFNLHIGVYFGYYLTMLAQNISPNKSGLSFGIAYGIASIGTFLMSLVRGGTFVESKEIAAIYILLAGLTMVLVFHAKDITYPLSRKSGDKAENASEEQRLSKMDYINNIGVNHIIIIIALITIISVMSSGLYYSLPVASNVNWLLIRAFYAIGLIVCGLIMDKSRLIGSICTIASLAYPLIFVALIGDGVNSTVALAFSYIFRGFITIYYVTVFTDLGYNDQRLLPLAAIGLMISRAVEAVVSLVLLLVPVPEVAQLIGSAICFLPLLAIFVIDMSKRFAPAPVTPEKKFALYAEKYDLTSREMEILKCLTEGLSDSEIADKFYISKNTVRFHVSNLLKKTESTSRVDAVRSLDKFES